MNRILYVVGPTATGKTALAVTLAQKCKGILVSADSVQAYKGLDVISGKDLPTRSVFNSLETPRRSDRTFEIGYYTFFNVPIFLLDILYPTDPFNVSDYFFLAQKVINDIWSQGKLPIVVGGTGFYIKALLEGISTIDVKPDEKLREELEVKSTEELREILAELDREKVEYMNNSDRNNKRRLVRAIEVAKALAEKQKKIVLGQEALVVGLKTNKETLDSRIDERVKSRIKQGALEEAESLYKNYSNLASQVKTANGYKQLFGYLKGEYGRDEAIEKWETSEHQNAKKQMTWFRKEKKIQWFDISDIGYVEKVVDLVKAF